MISQEIVSSPEYVVHNTIGIQFAQQALMWDFVKCLRKIEEDCIGQAAFSKCCYKIVDNLNELGSAGFAFSKSM